MAAEFIKRRERVEVVQYSLHFHLADHPGCGYSFECDEHGVVDASEFCPEALANLAKCTGGLDPNIIPDGVIKREWSYWENAVIKCVNCNHQVELYDSWATPCSHCGQEYNGAGQRLAPRSQWGEETGESIFDMEQGYYGEDW